MQSVSVRLEGDVDPAKFMPCINHLAHDHGQNILRPQGNAAMTADPRPLLFHDVHMLLAGASSLLARGLLVADDGENMSPKGLAAATLYALGNSTRWWSVAFTSPGKGAAVGEFPNSAGNLLRQGRGVGGGLWAGASLGGAPEQRPPGAGAVPPFARFTQRFMEPRPS